MISGTYLHSHDSNQKYCAELKRFSTQIPKKGGNRKTEELIRAWNYFLCNMIEYNKK